MTFFLDRLRLSLMFRGIWFYFRKLRALTLRDLYGLNSQAEFLKLLQKQMPSCKITYLDGDNTQ